MHVRSKSPIQQTRAIFTGNVKILNEPLSVELLQHVN